MPTTTASRARHLLHRVARCQTFTEFQRIGDAMGVSRDVPPAVYFRRFRARYAALLAFATTVPYPAGTYRFGAN